MRYGKIWLAATVVAALIGAGGASAAEAPDQVRVNPDGSVHAPAMDIPFSVFASPEAKAAFVEWAQKNAAWRARQVSNSVVDQVATVRQFSIGLLTPQLERALAAYPVTIAPKVIDGVYTDVITPKAGVAPENRDKVLIDVRSVASVTDARIFGKLEGAPVAVLGRIEVVAIGNRDNDAYKFPAATEDVAVVYRALLKRYKPQNIGILGSSAGGLLAADSIAWFQKEHLPRPGAVALLSSGATGWMEGDSSYVSAVLDGFAPPPPSDHRTVQNAVYFRDADMHDPLLAPGWRPDILKAFPPTLLITGTRDTAMSTVVQTHQQLVQQDVDAELHVWEGLDHDFFYDVRLPESRQAYAVIAKFFAKHLGHKPG
jgi:hypothetical protein